LYIRRARYILHKYTIVGKSFARQILGYEAAGRQWIYNQFEGNAWIRNHRWKLYIDGKLFDMTSDPLEQAPIRVDADDKSSTLVRKQLEQELETLWSSSEQKHQQ